MVMVYFSKRIQCLERDRRFRVVRPRMIKKIVTKINVEKSYSSTAATRKVLVDKSSMRILFRSISIPFSYVSRSFNTFLTKHRVWKLDISPPKTLAGQLYPFIATICHRWFYIFISILSYLWLDRGVRVEWINSNVHRLGFSPSCYTRVKRSISVEWIGHTLSRSDCIDKSKNQLLCHVITVKQRIGSRLPRGRGDRIL